MARAARGRRFRGVPWVPHMSSERPRVLLCGRAAAIAGSDAREGGVRGSTEPAPDEGSPCRLSEASSRQRPRRRRPFGARGGRSRHRDGGAARPTHPHDPCPVPGHRAGAARRAGAGPHRRHPEPRAARRAAQAPGRHRDAPRQDRHSGCRAPGAAGRGRGGLRRGALAQAGDPATGGHRDGRRGGAGHPGGPDRRRARRRAAVGGLAAAGQPVPRPGLLGRPTEHPPHRQVGHLGADRPAAQRVRTGRRRGACVHGAARPVAQAHVGRPGADAAPGPARRVRRGRAPELPARRRAGAGQDGPGAPRRGGGRCVPAARRRAERGEDELAARGGPVGAAPLGHRDLRRRRFDRRLRRHRDRQLRGARPPCGLAGQVRPARDGHRRGALHQEQVRPSVRSTCCSSPSGSGIAPCVRC